MATTNCCDNISANNTHAYINALQAFKRILHALLVCYSNCIVVQYSDALNKRLTGAYMLMTGILNNHLSCPNSHVWLA